MFAFYSEPDVFNDLIDLTPMETFMQTQELNELKKRFSDYRKTQKGKPAQTVRYPDELKRLVVDAKDNGASLTEISKLTSVSVPGVLNMIKRQRELGGESSKKTSTANKSASSNKVTKKVLAKGTQPESSTPSEVFQAISGKSVSGEERISVIVPTGEGNKEFMMKIRDVTKIFSYLLK